MDWLQLEAEDAELQRRTIEAHLEARRIAETESVAGSLVELLALPTFALAAPRVVDQLGRVGSPRFAMHALVDSVRELEVRRGDATPLLVEPILSIVLELGGSSRWAARKIARDPALAVELGLRWERPMGTARSTGDFVTPMRALARNSRGDTALFDQLLRRFRNRQMLGIALLELRDTDVRYTSARLADLASGAFEAALAFHRPRLEAEFGRPDPPCDMVVVGMGKLGGRELNFASDVDVIYLYTHDEGRAGELTMHPFFVELSRRVTRSIARITDHGFVFRVDLDLRPEGRRGPLANSVPSAERYYETWGRTWERAAWVKARAVAGSRTLGAEVERVLRPFIYPSALDYSAIEKVIAMKSRIDRQQRRAQLKPLAAGFDLKLGRGGIREIEFFVQAHQLLYGGRESRLRKTNTLEALFALEVEGHLSAQPRQTLSDAYHFLRRVEHRLQLVDEQQTHRMPQDGASRRELARSLGFETLEELDHAIRRHMWAVRAQFEGLLGAVEAPDEVPDAVLHLVDPETDGAGQRDGLAHFGADDPSTAVLHLEAAVRLAESPLHPSARSSVRRRGLALLSECLLSPSVDRALKHLPRFLRAIHGHRSYLLQLDDPRLRRGVARILGASDLLAHILVSNPALVPHVLLTGQALDRRSFQAELDDVLEEPRDLEGALGSLRGFQHGALLRIAIADLAQQIDWPTASRLLSDLAEILLRAARDLAIAEQAELYGHPEDPEADLALMAGGTLGAGELGYRSDLDLSGIYQGTGDTRGGSRGSVTVREFYTRVTQRLLSFLSMRMSSGVLYEVDVRLRPSGSQGALVTSLESLSAYHRKTAQLWERQALLRSRPIAGRDDVLEALQAVIEEAAYRAPVEPDLADQIRDVRARRARERARGRPRNTDSTFDLKLGRGGLFELEVVVQYLQLKHGRSDPSVRTTSTRDALSAFAEAKIIPRTLATTLGAAHDRLRRLMSWLRVAHDEMIDVLALRGDELRPIALTLGYEGDAAATILNGDIESDREVIRGAFERWLT